MKKGSMKTKKKPTMRVVSARFGSVFETQSTGLMAFANMVSKYGFMDGEDVPSFAEKARRDLLLAINGNAETLGSKHRCMAYDRLGLHNPTGIVFVPKQRWHKGYSNGGDAEGLCIWDETDDEFKNAVAEALGELVEDVNEMVSSWQ
jgi:hypothetical protein